MTKFAPLLALHLIARGKLTCDARIELHLVVRIQGSRFVVWGLGFRVRGSRFKVLGSWFRVWGSELRGQGSGEG